jgi:hypothetical protein
MQWQVCHYKLLFGPPLKSLQDIQTVDPTQLLSVNCLSFKDDPTKAFTVKVAKTDNISILKKKIKEEKARQLAHLDASDLILYKVSSSEAEVNSRLKEAKAEASSAVTSITLEPLEKVKDVFSEPLQESRIHIIFEHHSPGKSSRHR